MPPRTALRAFVVSSFLASLSACPSETTAPAPPPLPCTGASFEGAPLSVRCGALVDSQGREVLLNGINARVEGVFDVTFDDGRAPLEEIPPLSVDECKRMRALGFGALRLPINWSMIEPTELGGFDEAAIDRIAGVVDLARQAGMLVLLDIHQDAYSKEIGEDGAPYWAIVPPPPAKLGGPLRDLEARRLSKPVLAAFETFFGPGAEGDRLRGRFAAMAAHVAARFAGDDAVIGLELFNEPLATFEQLTTFHAAVFGAVRAVAPKKLVFFEPLATRNFSDRADIPSAPLGAGTVYAPHVYTAAFGSEEIRAAVTRDALERSYVNAREEADAWQAPLVVGEYGFPPKDPKMADYLAWHGELASEQRASTFFWVWKEIAQGEWGLFDRDAAGAWRERPAVIAALSRVRVQTAAGRIVSIRHPAGPASLVVEIEGASDGDVRDNLVSFGARYAPSRATCDGAVVAITPGEPARVPCGGRGRHVLDVRATPL